MKKKTILYIHHGKGIGGAPISLLHMIKQLDKERYKPVVLFLQDSEVIDLFANEKIDHVGPLNLYDFPHTKVWWFPWYLAPTFFRVVIDNIRTATGIARKWYKKIKPDLVHLNTSSLIAWGKVARKMNIPVVWHVREPLAAGYFGLRKKFVSTQVKRHSSAILPICKHDASPWKSNPKVSILYNAVDPKIFDHQLDPKPFLEKYGLNKDDPKILYLGGLSKEKGTLEILKIFGQIKQKLPHAQLLIAGYFDRATQCSFSPKRYFPAYKFKRNVLNTLPDLGSNLHLLGAIKNVPLAMAASDVIVFPATVGHFARPVIEAGFMKKPVVASNFAPLNELVLRNQTGYLIDSNNHKEWVEKLCLLLKDNNLSKKMGAAGYTFCTSHFHIKNQIEKLEDIYSDVLSNNFKKPNRFAI